MTVMTVQTLQTNLARYCACPHMPRLQSGEQQVGEVTAHLLPITHTDTREGWLLLSLGHRSQSSSQPPDAANHVCDSCGTPTLLADSKTGSTRHAPRQHDQIQRSLSLSLSVQTTLCNTANIVPMTGRHLNGRHSRHHAMMWHVQLHMADDRASMAGPGVASALPSA